MSVSSQRKSSKERAVSISIHIYMCTHIYTHMYLQERSISISIYLYIRAHTYTHMYIQLPFSEKKLLPVLETACCVWCFVLTCCLDVQTQLQTGLGSYLPPVQWARESHILSRCCRRLGAAHWRTWVKSTRILWNTSYRRWCIIFRRIRGRNRIKILFTRGMQLIMSRLSFRRLLCGKCSRRVRAWL